MVPSYRVPFAIAACLAVLSGCGGDADIPSSASTPPEAGVAQVASAPYAAVLDKDAFIADLLTAIDSYGTVHLSITAGTIGAAEVDVQYTNERSLVHVDADLAQRGPSQFVIADGVVYVEQSQGGPWAVIDRDDPSYGSLLRTFTNIGPHPCVAGLGRGITSISRQGTRVIDGSELDTYEVRVDPARARGAFRALAGNSGISETLIFHFLVDPSGLLRQVDVDVTGETTTVELTGWGEPVMITVPTADQLITP